MQILSLIIKNIVSNSCTIVQFIEQNYIKLISRKKSTEKKKQKSPTEIKKSPVHIFLAYHMPCMKKNLFENQKSQKIKSAVE